MTLTKYRIGDLITVIDELNDTGIRRFYGININKEFMLTAANTDGLDENKYKIVRKNRFVYSGMQTGRDECIRISMYTEDEPIIVSPAYTTFEVTAVDTVIPQYFFMKFLTKEKDRYGAFCSDGSIRSNLDWDVFCDIEIELPPLSIQQKYVDVYNAMVANQQSYERGLDDLKLVCDAYIDELKGKNILRKMGTFISLCNNTNDDLKYGINDVIGISNEKVFIDTKANMEGVSLRPYAIVKPNEFAYVTVTSRNGGKISLARNNTSNTYICSSSYIVFRVNNYNEVMPEYLSIYFGRSEFDRYSRFNSWGSARETFTWDEMCDVEIPIPNIEIQRGIVNMLNTYIKRNEINERLKEQLKKMCPILIKGSIEEGRAKEA